MGQKLMPAVWEELAELRAAIARVRELHSSIPCFKSDCECEGLCRSCSSLHWEVDYPCPTIKALDGEQ